MLRLPEIRKLCLFISLIVNISISCVAQKDTNAKYKCVSIYDKVVKKQVCTTVDKDPEFTGGYQALVKYVMVNFKIQEQTDFQGRFDVEFVIDKDGTLQGARIRNKIGDLSPMEKEILRVLNHMPKWEPGECFGLKVPVKVYLPIRL